MRVRMSARIRRAPCGWIAGANHIRKFSSNARYPTEADLDACGLAHADVGQLWWRRIFRCHLGRTDTCHVSSYFQSETESRCMPCHGRALLSELTRASRDRTLVLVVLSCERGPHDASLV